MNNYEIQLAKRLISKAKDLKHNLRAKDLVMARSDLDSCADSVEKLNLELEKEEMISKPNGGK